MIFIFPGFYFLLAGLSLIWNFLDGGVGSRLPQTGPCFAPVFADSSFFSTPISCGVGSFTFTGPFCEDSAGWCTDPAGDITSGVGSRLTISGPFSAESFAWTNFSVFFDLFTDTNFATNSDTWCNSLQTGIASGVGSHNFLGPDFKYFATYSELGGAPTLICIAITADWVTHHGVGSHRSFSGLVTSPAVLSGASGSCSAHRHIVRQIVQWNPILIAAHCRVGSCSIFTGLATEYPIFGSFAIFIFLQHIQFSGVGSLTLTGRAFPAFLHTDHFHWIGLGAQTACPKTFNLETLISDLVQAWHCDTNRGGLPWIYFHWPCWLCWQLWTTFLTLVQGVSHSFTILFISGDRALTLTSQDTAGLPPVLISSLFSEYILRQWPFFYFLTVLLISWNFLGSLLLACSAFAEIAHSHWHKFESLLAGISHLSVDWTPSFGRSGPKSRRRVVRGCSIFWSLLLLYMMRPCKGEGYGPSMGAVAASSQFCFQTIDGAKLHGLQPTLSCGSPSGLETNRRTNKVVKRSLNRAYARALDQGFAWYRGHSYTAQELSSMGCTAPTERPEPLPSWQDLSMCNQHHSPKRRLVTWQWNCGGLTNAKLDELKAWLGANKVDIAVVLETRWRFDGEWSDPDWNLLHSGEGAHLGKGILTLISKRLCTSTNIKWQIHASGRLVHVRLHTSTRPVDILACYQHTYQKNPKCMKARNTWWSLLDQVLHSLPHRNNLILLGDLNCNLAERTPSVGSSTFLWKGCQIRGTVHDDQSTLLHILRIHDLIALNASSSALGPTYVHYNQASRLDYICVRRMFADGEARRTVYLWQSPFIDQTNTGHAPILCTIAKHWIPPYAMSRFQKVTMQQRRNSRQAFLNQDATWRSFATETQAVLSNHLTRTDPANSIIEQMHQDVMRMFFTSFPAGNNVSSIQPWQTGLPHHAQQVGASQTLPQSCSVHCTEHHHYMAPCCTFHAFEETAPQNGH